MMLGVDVSLDIANLLLQSIELTENDLQSCSSQVGKSVRFIPYNVKDMQHLSFRAELKNAFNETYSSRATYGQEFSTVNPLYEPGRAFLLTAKATF